MADTYLVVHGDVSAELPGLFAGGFTASTKPTAAQVAAQISTADVIITLKVRDTAGSAPSVNDAAAPIAKRYIIEWVKAQVVRMVYAGNDPAAVRSATQPYDDNAAAMLKAIEQLGAQAEGTGDAAPRVLTASTVGVRESLVTDADLNPATSHGEKRF